MIESKLAEIEAAAVTAVGGIGFGKRVGEGTNIAVERFAEVAIHDGLQTELATIRRAQAKLADGDAGRCDECDQAIPRSASTPFRGRPTAVPSSRCTDQPGA